MTTFFFFLLIPAVRFGRIPKREKQRMLLEMQNAMNNMMSNNSQLHSMLHGHQSASQPVEASDNSSSPSSSSSSASDSPLCSSPSSPQCPQDSESLISMDTNSSSASSCASDSGEDEAVITVRGQHHDAFMYGQQRSPRQSQALPLLATVSMETGCDSRMEEQQEGWNCWNNNVVVGGYQHNSYSQRVTNTAYREQQNSAPCSEHAGDSQRQHEFNTHSSFSGCNGPTGFINNRTHLVSDLFFFFCMCFITTHQKLLFLTLC